VDSVLTFFKTLDETFGNGIGWSLSPTSEGRVSGWWAACGRKSGNTFEHVFDQYGTLCNFLVDDELFVIGGDEKNHCGCGWEM
jgi:hypothetical protein